MTDPTAAPATDPTAAPATPPAEASVLRRLVDPYGLDGALLRYRVMACVVGVGLATLVFVGMPLQYGFGQVALVEVAGPIHGFFYIVYLVAALDLARRARFGFGEMFAMVGAGFIPGLAFVIERRITRRVRTEVLPRWTAPRRA